MAKQPLRKPLTKNRKKKKEGRVRTVKMFLTKPSWDDKWCLEKNEPNNRKKKKKMNEKLCTTGRQIYLNKAVTRHNETNILEFLKNNWLFPLSAEKIEAARILGIEISES